MGEERLNMIQEGRYHSFQTFYQLKKQNKIKRTKKKKNNIGVALLYHAIYFSKPSDTDKIYFNK